MQTNDLCKIELFEIELFDHLTVKRNDLFLIELLVIYSNTSNHLNVFKCTTLGSFKNVINKVCLQIIYLTCMYKEDLAINNVQYAIKPNQTNP